MLISVLGLNSVIHQVGAYYADNLYYDSICLDGNKAYVTDATLSNPTGFIILDVTNPAQPVLAGTCNNPNQLHDIDIYLNRAYIAAGNAGLQVWDVSIPNASVLLTSVNLAGSCEELTISGDRLYAAVPGQGLMIFDITDNVPELLGSYTGVSPYDVTVIGNLAYIADSNTGLRIVNVSNPAACVPVGSYPLILAKSIVVEGNIIFLSDNHNDGFLIDVTNPASPVFLSEIPDMWIQESYLRDGYLFTMLNNPGTGSRELKVFDITNPAQPQYATSVIVPSYGTSIDVRGDYLYLTVNSTGVIIFDISEMINTSLIVTSNIPGNAVALNVVGDLVYIVDEEQSILQIDVSDSSDPQLLSQLAFPYPFGDMAIDGDLAYVTAHENGLHIIRLREDNPPQPDNFEVLAILPTDSNAIEICQSGDYAYIANQDNLMIADIGVATAPLIVSHYANPGVADFIHIAKYHNYVYAGGWSDFVCIIDVSDPHAPVLAGSLNNPSITESLKIYDHYLIQSNYSLPMRIYDLSNPVYPALVGTISIGSAEYSIPFIFEHYLFLSLPRLNNIRCYDLSNPASPLLVRDYYWNLPTYDLFYRQGLLYTCNGEFGFSILEMELPSLSDDPQQVPELTYLKSYPNPFSVVTTFSYKVEGDQMVKLEIFNLKGQLIRRVFSGKVISGTHTIDWNGTDDQNRMLGSGVYIAKLTTGKKSITKRIIRMN